MNKKQKKLFEQIKNMGISENVAGSDFEKIKMLEVLMKTLGDPNDKKEVEDEIAKLRASPEYKENEVKKKLKKIEEDF